MKRLAILGSTGSIGRQTLDVVRKHPDRFRVVALVAGSNAEALAQQADEFPGAFCVLAEGNTADSRYARGPQAILDAAAHADADVVVNALVGSRGLVPTLTALNAGKTVALANKESLVAGGDLVMDLVKDNPERLLPVDSEHSAIFQCLAGNRLTDVRRILLTASGGPFRGRSAQQMQNASVADALAHPTWRMGAKITIDSATLMNKGLEAIEAMHLFRVGIDRIELVVHPQSIVHGIVEFTDGSTIIQASRPDMRLPLQVALAWPERLEGGAEPIDWPSLGSLDFAPIDSDAFGAPALAFHAARRGGTFPAVLNAANEEAVEAFLAERVSFGQIIQIVEQVLEQHQAADTLTLAEVLGAEEWARAQALEVIARLSPTEGRS